MPVGASYIAPPPPPPTPPYVQPGTWTATLQATLATTTTAYGLGAYGLGGQTVVALPPSSLDATNATIHVYINGALLLRQYDPTMTQP